MFALTAMSGICGLLLSERLIAAASSTTIPMTRA
jgi:hypothetical protein